MEKILIFKLFLIVFIPCFLSVTVIFNALANSNVTSIFHSETGGVAKKYNITITPMGWAFSIWGLIYVWQYAICVFMLASLCIKYESGILCTNELVFSVSFLVPYLFNFVFNLTWIFVFDRSWEKPELLALATIVLLATSLMLLTALGISVYNSANLLRLGFYSNKHSLLWTDRLLVHNGIGLYLGWTTVAQCLNIATSLVHFNDAKDSVACQAALALLTIWLLVYLLLDLLMLDRFTRYLVTPYFVSVFALATILVRNDARLRTNNPGAVLIFTLVLLAVAVLATVCKLVCSFVRHLRYPFDTGTGVFVSMAS